jgi:hypothetical protein
VPIIVIIDIVPIITDEERSSGEESVKKIPAVTKQTIKKNSLNIIPPYFYLKIKPENVAAREIIAAAIIAQGKFSFTQSKIFISPPFK